MGTVIGKSGPNPLSRFFQETEVSGLVKEGKKWQYISGVKFEDCHPGLIHEPVPNAQLISLGSSFELKGVIGTKIITPSSQNIKDNFLLKGLINSFTQRLP